MTKLVNASVVVVGMGGVGSHAAHMLARSGIGRLILIDFDQVTLSSTNRHATATLEDVGTSKVEAVKKFLAKVCPNVEVIARTEMFTEASASSLLDDTLDGRPNHTFLVDAIDDIPTKASLIKACIDRSINCISSMGAACKSDPTRIHIGELKCATRDPLCTKLRWCLKKMEVDAGHPNIKIIYSSEKSVMSLAPLTKEQAANPDRFGAVDNMRIRVLPVLGTMPAIIGQSCAAYVLCEIGGKPFSPVSTERVGKSVRHKLLQHINSREGQLKKAIEDKEAIEGAVSGSEVDIDDVEYLLMDLWKCQCAITDQRLGSQLELIKWDITKPARVDNLVLLSTEGWRTFRKAGGKDGLDKAMHDKIEARIQFAKVLCKLE
jgi:tRNA A37 threonylcarbamoyladenosine dehydratase